MNKSRSYLTKLETDYQSRMSEWGSNQKSFWTIIIYY